MKSMEASIEDINESLGEDFPESDPEVEEDIEEEAEVHTTEPLRSSAKRPEFVPPRKSWKSTYKERYGPPKTLHDKQYSNSICLIHTGGTIGMIPKSPELKELTSAPRGTLIGYLKSLPAFAGCANRIVSEDELPGRHDLNDLQLLVVVECEKLIDSTNATFETWNEIATRIFMRRLLYHSFVVTHGTDSLAHTACALTFMLGFNASCIPPIVVTGSQVPIYAPLTDGLNNLLGACCAAGWVWGEGTRLEFGEPWPEVTVYFDNKLMLGSRVVKKDAQRLDAFDSPNMGILAIFSGGKFEKNSSHLNDLKEKRNLSSEIARQGKLGLFLVPRKVSVRILSVAPDCVRSWGLPGYDSETIDERMVARIDHDLERLGWNKLSGVVVCAYGAGNAPYSVQHILRRLRRRFSIPIGIITECLSGAAEHVYESSVKDCGVTLEDMTLSAAYAKMVTLTGRALLLRKQYREKCRWVEYRMTVPVRGEITKPNAHKLKSGKVRK